MNDLIPEEQDPQNEELIAVLRRVNLNPLFVDPRERTQILSQAKARLFPAEPEVARFEEIPPVEGRGLDSFPRRPHAHIGKRHQHEKLVHLLNILAAVLVVALLIGTSLLIFGPWSPFKQEPIGTTPSIGPVGAPVVVRAQEHGIEMTMQVTPGPYFLSELVKVEVSLTNHTQTTFRGDTCHLDPRLIMIDGEGQQDAHLVRALTAVATDFGVKKFPHGTNLATAFATEDAHTDYLSPCDNQINPTFLRQLQPTKTIAITGYVVLTKSGHVTLAARAAFQRATTGQNGLVPAPDPLDGHWPTLHMSVSAKVPPDRTLRLHQQPTQLIVDVPLAARDQLFYAYSFTCSFGDRGTGTKVDKEVGNTINQPTFTLQRPGCHDSIIDRFLNWTYVFGAIGYSMTVGMYSY